jgi:hypothetical protein
MTKDTILAAIELTAAELDTVSGGVTFFNGKVNMGGRGGPTAFSGNVTINADTQHIVFAQNRSGEYADVVDGTPHYGRE